MHSFTSFAWRLSFCLALLGCESEPPIFTAPDREIGDRTPLTRACDELDPTRCLLPWPSNAFTVADPSTPTGLRLQVDMSSLSRTDDGRVLSRADGFSRVSTVIAGFPVRLDPASAEGAVHVHLAQHDAPDVGREVAVRVEVVVDDRTGYSLVIAQPLAPLAPGADHVVVIDDALRTEDGAAVEASHGTLLALGLVPAHSEEEAALAGYAAPLRAFLETQAIDPARVLRAWDFTTRSADDPLRRLRAMRQAAIDAVDAGEVTVRIDAVEHREEGPLASIVEGHLVGLPNYLAPDGLSIDETGAALAIGTREAPFRIALPRGTGDYRMLMYGHGTGGTVQDANFDEAIAESGAAKIGIEFYGWTETTVIDTFLSLQNMALGSSVAASGLVQAVADAAALRRAMTTIVGDALAAEELGGMPNPHAGRRPDDSVPIWVGGSLGGTMGLVIAASDPEIEHAVLNVPGAAWGTWVRQALQFGYIEGLIAIANGGDFNVPIAVAISQTMLDEADGASWVDVLAGEHPVMALVQESIGDPVLPNPGSELVGRVTGAAHIGSVLVPVDGLEPAESAMGRSGFTQYWVAGTDALDLHGFAAESTPAAAAAQEQIFDFVRSAWDGEARISIPTGCAGGSCDFRGE
ncbi:MAG: hypothetical protein M3Y87_27405 [Myxococcota bacterium]|nr:hypothetical protein [Myxococcota bacterium]